VHRHAYHLDLSASEKDNATVLVSLPCSCLYLLLCLRLCVSQSQYLDADSTRYGRIDHRQGYWNTESRAKDIVDETVLISTVYQQLQLQLLLLLLLLLHACLFFGV
jgi:hypothetical protein